MLVAALVVVSGAWGFIELADEVQDGETRAIDEWLLRSFRNPDDPSDPIGPVWFEESVRDLTALGSSIVVGLVVAAVLGLLLSVRSYRDACLVLGSTVGGQILCVVLKRYFARPRPTLVPGLARVHLSSFPSGHSMLAVVAYLTLGAILAESVPGVRLKLYILSVAMVLAFLVGMSRIYLGVHYPTDVLAGWCAGLSWAVLCWLVARWLHGPAASRLSDSSTR
ncbi:MAG: phosphatase PAP2 family protein [Isosphaeraceae bacterium]